MLKSILIVLYLVLFNCSKIINMDKYNNKSSKEERNLKEEKDIKGQNLIKAVKEQDKKKVIKALKTGSDVNYEDYKQKTPLMYALAGSKESIVKILLNSKADISKIYVFDKLFKWETHFKFLKMLIKKGYLNVNTHDYKGNTLLKYFLHYFECCSHENGRLDKVCPFHKLLNYIIEKNFNVNYKNIKGNVPLVSALLSYDLYAIDLLLRNGADPNALNNYGNSPLMEFLEVKPTHSTLEDSIFVAKTKYTENIIKLLVKFGADINIKNSSGDTPLILAAKSHNLEALKTLLKLCVDKVNKNKLGDDALITAVKKVDIVSGKLVEYNEYYKYIISMDNKKEIIKRLVVSGKDDVDTKDKDGNTPLILVVKASNLKLVKTLLKLKANIFVNNNLGENSLIVAIKKINEISKNSSKIENSQFIEQSKLKYNKFILKESILVLKKLLEFAPLDLIDVDSLINESPNTIQNPKSLKLILNMLFENKRFLKLLFYKNNHLSIKRIICFKNFDINEELKNKIIEEIEVEKLLFYDTFTFKSKSLLIGTFFSVVKSYNLEKRDDVREININLIDSLIDYHIDKTNNKNDGYEEKFLKKLDIIKSKINTFTGDLYFQIRKSKKNKK